MSLTKNNLIHSSTFKITLFSIISILELIYTWFGRAVYQTTSQYPPIIKSIANFAKHSSLLGNFWIALTLITILILVLSVFFYRKNNSYQISVLISSASLILSILIIL